ncbi:unnamed protein product [Prorocentrum cordatum]|uniref:Cyclin N-terminal domain-containing protein n=1 Tax=Prorocentrum cordatum TaxID=2364126 RepID=A0ABN9VHC3_9DINO|nr:unnamed protein product [Polarella glacialis]
MPYALFSKASGAVQAGLSAELQRVACDLRSCVGTLQAARAGAAGALQADAERGDAEGLRRATVGPSEGLHWAAGGPPEGPRRSAAPAAAAVPAAAPAAEARPSVARAGRLRAGAWRGGYGRAAFTADALWTCRAEGTQASTSEPRATSAGEGTMRRAGPRPRLRLRRRRGGAAAAAPPCGVPVRLQDLPPGVLQHVADFGPTFLGRVHFRRACASTQLVEWRWAPPLSISEDLSGLGLGDVGACAVAEALARGASDDVVRLHVGNNAIGDRGAAALAGALAESRAPVRRVYMENNEVGLVGARAMLAAISSSGTLKEVDLRGNRLSSAGKREVRYSRKGKQMFLDWDLPSPTYMSDTQPHINPRMRCILFDWLMDVFASSFHTPMPDNSFSPSEMFQTFSIVDRYLSRRPVAREHFQLVGAAGAFVSARHGELGADREPAALKSVRRLVRVSDHAFTDEDLLRTAGDIREALEHELDQPTVARCRTPSC